MITIHHNFDETKFKWLWAKYVKAGNIEKHCTACMIGPYSKKFSGSSNKDLLQQPTIVMNEVSEGGYEAIYFCGVLKAGYLNINPEKNNYRHNVHFAIKPVDGAHDVWDFENWHVEIEGGILEPIPMTSELGSKFFKEPYTPHFYTCRIFRWMVGHFYPKELTNILHGYPEEISTKRETYNTRKVIADLIESGFNHAKSCFEFEGCEDESSPFFSIVREDLENEDINFKSDVAVKKYIVKNNLFNRLDFAETILDIWNSAGGSLELVSYADLRDDYMTEADMQRYIRIGIEDYIDTIYPYQQRFVVTGWDKESKIQFH